MNLRYCGNTKTISSWHQCGVSKIALLAESLGVFGSAIVLRHSSVLVLALSDKSVRVTGQSGLGAGVNGVRKMYRNRAPGALPGTFQQCLAFRRRTSTSRHIASCFRLQNCAPSISASRCWVPHAPGTWTHATGGLV